jgi:splicing factor 3B subunit 3
VTGGPRQVNICFRLTFKGAFFFLLQTEDGDIFKLTIEHQDEEVIDMRIKYFDTIPVATSLCILKSGYLFAASEFGNQ